MNLGWGDSLGCPCLNRGSLCTSLALCPTGRSMHHRSPLPQGCSLPVPQPLAEEVRGSSAGSREQPQKGNEAIRDKWEPEARAAVESAQCTLLQSTCLLRKCTERKPCLWKLQKKPIFAINILCLTWTCALFLPDVGKGIQPYTAALKAGQQCLADHSPEVAPAPGNPMYPAAVGSCADSSGPGPAAGH